MLVTAKTKDLNQQANHVILSYQSEGDIYGDWRSTISLAVFSVPLSDNNVLQLKGKARNRAPNLASTTRQGMLILIQFVCQVSLSISRHLR